MRDLDPVPRKTALSPRNVWFKLRGVLELGAAGDFIAAERQLGDLLYDPLLNPDLIRLYREQLDRMIAEQGGARPVPGGAAPIARSWDYLAAPPGGFHPPIRRLLPGAVPPHNFPASLALPRFVGARNETAFLHDAAAALAAPDVAPRRIRRLHVIHAAPPDAGDPRPEAARLLDELDAACRAGRDRIDIDIRLSVFARGASGPPGRIELVPHHLLDPEARAFLGRIAADSDLILFLSGRIRLDSELLLRLLPVAETSDLAVQPIVPAGSEAQATLFGRRQVARPFAGPYPFRALSGLNLAVSARLLRQAGPPDARFASTFTAAGELGFRLYNQGAYFVPTGIPLLEDFDDRSPRSGDHDLYTALCPAHRDRTSDGRFEIPKISIYIPGWNAASYIRRAVDSVLEQDVEDLEVCIADDGSQDGTLSVLERHYADDPRIRWESGRNGGIGHASNRAISMARGMYIGQLDSDDCLKPGAVRRLAGLLDGNPDLVCVYSSAERIDAGGAYMRDEYSWPVFSREKMMMTSIAHHFRMFRRHAWARVGGFREDIVNAVDYDFFLKMAESGRMEHVDEVLYQRRWHGRNTSSMNEAAQTSNTYRVQHEALRRQGLARYWKVSAPDPAQPRMITYARRPGTGVVVFWPDYSYSNPYAKLLYARLSERTEVIAGPIDAAMRALAEVVPPARVTFHLHWLNFLFRDLPDTAAAQAAADEFHGKLAAFCARGGRLVWTVHNAVSHEADFPDIEMDLSRRIADLAEVVHLHSLASLPEVRPFLDLKDEKVRVARHGNYIGAYPDLVSGPAARRQLGLGPDDDVMLFTGQVRPYKGIDSLLQAFRSLLRERPRLRLIVAGEARFDIDSVLGRELDPRARERIIHHDRFIEDEELQLFFRAADLAVYPYRRILTSGSLMLSLSFGVPTVVPDVGMTREVLGGGMAGILYDGEGGGPALEAALREMFRRKDANRMEAMRQAASELARKHEWQDFSDILAGAPHRPMPPAFDPALGAPDARTR